MGIDAYITIDNKVADCYKARKMCSQYYNRDEILERREILVHSISDSAYDETTLSIFVITENNCVRSKFVNCVEDKRDRDQLIGIVKIHVRYKKPFKVIAFLNNTYYVYVWIDYHLLYENDDDYASDDDAGGKQINPYKVKKTLPKRMFNFEWASIKKYFYPLFDKCKICTPLDSAENDFCRYNCVFHKNCIKTLIANGNSSCVNCGQSLFRSFEKLDISPIIISSPSVKIIDM